MKGFLLAIVLLLAAAAQARTFSGVVTHVTDGDTLWVRPNRGGKPVEIRVLDIDAPEGCQAFGRDAADALRKRVLHQEVKVLARGEDDYHRQLAKIEHRGEDVGAWLVRGGHAWSGSFHGKPGPYAALQAQARRERIGLWASGEALEPRQFRQRFGRCH